MTIAFTVALLLVAAEPTAAKRVAVPKFSTVGLPEDLAGFATQHFATALDSEGVTVVTDRDIATLIGMERQRELMGCNEQSSCLVELANALGVDAVLVGDVGKFGSLYQINLRLLSSSDGKSIQSVTAQAEGDRALLDELTRAAKKLAPALRPAGKVSEPVVEKVETKEAPEAPSRRIPVWSYAAAGVGVAAIGTGAFFFTRADSAYKDLTGDASLGPLTNGTDVRDSGRTAQTVGWVATGVGVACLGAAVFGFVRGADSPPAVSAVPTSNGAMVVFSASMP